MVYDVAVATADQASPTVWSLPTAELRVGAVGATVVCPMIWMPLTPPLPAAPVWSWNELPVTPANRTQSPFCVPAPVVSVVCVYRYGLVGTLSWFASWGLAV